MDNLNILIIDDHPVVTEGLKSFLQEYPDISILAEADSAKSGLELLRHAPVDVVLMELVLPDMDGPEAIQLYHEEYPDLAILVYTNSDDESAIYRSLKAGANGYLLKKTPLEQIVEALRNVRLQKYILSPELSPAIVDFYLENRDLSDDYLGEYDALTEREKQVFRLLAEGQETQQIADFLCISPKTVAKHRSAIKKKLLLNNVAEMAQYAISLGLIDVNSH